MDLPNEVLVLVFEFLDVRDLASCARVCSQWTGLAATNTLWLAHCRRRSWFVPAPSPSSSTSSTSSASCSAPRQARVVDWKRELRGAWSARRNWCRGQPTRHQTYESRSRVSGLCFDRRFLYAGLNRGSVQVFDLQQELDQVGDDDTVININDSNEDGDDMALDTPPPPTHEAAAPRLPLCIIFPRSSECEDEVGEPQEEEEPHAALERSRAKRGSEGAETGAAVPEKPMAHGSHKKSVMLHSPHSSYSDVLALHQRRLYAVSGKNITMWNVDVDEAKEIQRIEIAYEGHTNKISCIDFHDHHMITGSWDRSIRVWDINTGECLTAMSGHTANIKHLQAVDNRIVSSSNDNTLVEWDTRTYAQVRSTYCTRAASNQAVAAVSAFHYDPDRDLIVLGHREGTVQRLSYSQIFAKPSFPLGMPGSTVMRLHGQIIHRIQMDADKVLSSGQDGLLAVWDLATGGLMYHLEASRRGTLNAMQFDHTQLCYASGSSVVRLTFT